MLGKLIKHEFKAVNRLMIPIHLGLILITIVGRFYVQFAMRSPMFHGYSYNVWEGIINFTLISFYVVALLAILIVTELYLMILRPRKNFFTDEGYLTHTLPVSATEHIFSKLIVALVWTTVDGILIVLSVLTMFINMDFLRHFGEIWSELITSFPDVFGVPAGVGLPVFLIMGLLSSTSSILIIYMCMAIGHSFNSHRILASVGVYVGIEIVSSLISSIFTALIGVSTIGKSTLFMVSYASTGMYNYFWPSFWFSSIVSVAMGVGAFLITNHFMTKRLNLE
jgi:hypothetical protein